jgi:hypothetical protein
MGNVASNTGFTHSHVDYVGVRLSHSYCPDCGCFEETIRDVLPVCTTVGGFPHSSGTGAKVKHHRFFGVTGNGNYTSASVRANISPLQNL